MSFNDLPRFVNWNVDVGGLVFVHKHADLARSFDTLYVKVMPGIVKVDEMDDGIRVKKSGFHAELVDVLQIGGCFWNERGIHGDSV